MRGYKEEGTTTTPFDMVMLNDLDRFHLVMDVIDRVPASARTRPTSASRWPTSGIRARAYTRARRRPAGDPRLDLGRASDPRARSSSSTRVVAASSSRVLEEDDAVAELRDRCQVT